VASDDDDLETPDVHVRNFLVDLGFEEGTEFCSRLLDTDDFRLEMLRPFGGRGARSMGRPELASQIAARLVEHEIDTDAFLLAYCTQPRTWLCVRSGLKGSGWEKLGKGSDFLTKRKKSSGLHWYGPFGSGKERWYIVAKNVPHLVEVETGKWETFPMRWQVAVQVTPTYAALHWNNSSTRESEEAQSLPRFPYWQHIPQIYKELSDHLGCDYDPRQPNLSELLLHFAFDRYFDDRKNYNWVP
jgi:hypothetical protein